MKTCCAIKQRPLSRKSKPRLSLPSLKNSSPEPGGLVQTAAWSKIYPRKYLGQKLFTDRTSLQEVRWWLHQADFDRQQTRRQCSLVRLSTKICFSCQLTHRRTGEGQATAKAKAVKAVVPEVVKATKAAKISQTYWQEVTNNEKKHLWLNS